MRRDARIVSAVLAAIPLLILGAAVLCSWAVANGASPRWRLLFRMLCHGIERRCLTLFEVPMPICARCTAIYAGLLIGVSAFLLLRHATLVWRHLEERIVRAFAFLAAVPMAVDGFSQLAGLRESTNELRIATGLLAGFAFALWALTAVQRHDVRAMTTS